MDTPPERPQARKLAAPLKRIGIACLVFFAIWLLFLQITPRLLMHYSPPPQPRPEASPALPPHLPLAPPAPAPMPPAPPAPPPAPPPPPMPSVSDQMVEAKIAMLEQKQERTLHTIALLDAYDRLKDRARSGAPYAEEMARMRAVAGNDAALAESLKALEPHAGSGIPRLETLQAGFAEAARSALHPALPPDAGIWERLKARLASLISIRRVGEVQGDTPEAIIARAEAALNRQDMEMAINELSHLQGGAMIAMQPWMGQAMAYTARDKALLALRTAILTP